MNRTGRVDTLEVEGSRIYLTGKEYRRQRRKRLGLAQPTEPYLTKKSFYKSKVRAANKRAKVSRKKNRALK